MMLKPALRPPLRAPMRGATTLREGGGYTAEAQALFARFTTPPTAARKTLINNLIVALKAAGVWTKLDALYLMAAADSQAAQRNWIADAYNLTEVSAPAFVADQGYTGNGTTSYLNSLFAANAGVKYLQDSASFGYWSRTAAQVDVNDAGTFGGTGVSIRTRNTTDNLLYRINQAAATTVSVAVTDGSGLIAINRSGAGATQAYRNGAVLGTPGAQASATPIVNTFTWGGANGNLGTRQEAAGFVGGSLTAGEHAALYAAVSAYMVAVGAA